MGPTLPRATFTVSGRVLRVFSFRRRAKGFTPPPLLSSSYLSPRSLIHLSTGPACAREAASPAISSPTVLDRNRRPYHPEIPTSGTVRPQSFSLSRRLTPPATLASLFHPACTLGVPPGPDARRSLSAMAGQTAPGLPLQSFLPSRDDHLVGGLLSCTPSGAPAKERFGNFTPREGSKAAQQMLQSFDHRKVGVSRGSEPRAPAFLRFMADRPHS